jgi:hypothetical protein
MKQAPAILVEVIEFCDLDASRKKRAHKNPGRHSDERSRPVDPPPIPSSGDEPGPSDRAGFVLVPDTGASSGTMMPNRTGIE